MYPDVFGWIRNMFNRFYSLGRGKSMRTVKIYEEGETVMIKAKISKVIFDKDKITYELRDFNTDQAYLSKFTEKDIVPYLEEEE